MSIKSQIAKSLGRLSHWALTNFTNGGSSFPGKLASTIDPHILGHLAKDYDVAIITGTNGKTLTTALASQALKQIHSHIVTNSSGSNMSQGIISTFLDAPKVPENSRGMAVLEVDEGSLKNVVKYLKPKIIVQTNLFEDQLDRYGSLGAIYQLLVDAAIEAPNALIISNADCPILNSKDLPNPRKYFGFQAFDNHHEDSDQVDHLLCPLCQEPLSYQGQTYGDLGDYYCTHCFFKRPPLDYAVTSIDQMTLEGSQFTINDVFIQVPVAGLYNIYNALAAFSLAHYLGVPAEDINHSFQISERVFGRQEKIELHNHDLLLNLVKNPVGFNQVVDLLGLDHSPSILVTLFNNNYADGKDVSWFKDANFEAFKFMPIKAIYTAGSQKDALKERFEVAGFDPDHITEIDLLDDLLNIIKESPYQRVHVLASYTGTLELRKLLMAKGFIKTA